MSKLEAIWHNYVTGEDTTQGPDTDEWARQLIPQDPSALAMYDLYRQHGSLSILEAMINVMNSALGKPPDYPVTGWK